MSNALQWAPMISRGDEVHIPFARRPAASIDPADTAAIAHAALTTDDHRGAAHQLSGPEVLTPVEELAVLAELLRRPLKAVEPSLAAVRAGMARGGVRDEVVDAIIARTVGTDDGPEPLPTVAQVLGRPPRTFARWTADHLEHFRRPARPAAPHDHTTRRRP